jgi:predicted naringenin-chalcone synthase
MDGKIIGIGTALPPHVYGQRDIFEALGYNHHFWPIFRDIGIQRRHFAVPVADIKTLSFQEQQEHYQREAAALSMAAARECLDRVAPEDLGMVISAHCTAFGFPGPTLAHALGRELGCGPGVFYENIASMGCEGGFPGLRRAWDYYIHSRRPALVVACELASCSYFPENGGPDRENGYELLRSNALFGDAAAAILVGGDELPHHPVIEDAAACTDAAYRDELGYTWRDGRLRIRLGRRIPEIAADLSQRVADDIFRRHRLAPADIAHWVIHPGGAQVLDAVRDALGLPEESLNVSREVLRRFGNCSSATIGLIGKELMRQGRPRPGDRGLIISLGPGITAGATLLRWEV